MNRDPEASLPHKMPAVLYHYTSIAGVNGIVNEKFVWSSSAHFMNDAQEHAYGVQLIQALLKEGLKQDTDGEAAFELAQMFNLFETIAQAMSQIEISVFSMTARGDLLSQWRGYCPPEGGYSIGFDSAALVTAFEKQHCSIKECLYDSSAQRAILSTFISQVVELAKEKADPKAGKGRKYINVDVIASMLRGIIHHLPILKHPEFAEEQEWRSISQWACSTYRISRTLAIPASRLRLVPSPQARIPIKEIIVGPCAHGDLAKRGLLQLLIASGYTFEEADAMVRLSKIPYRLL